MRVEEPPQGESAERVAALITRGDLLFAHEDQSLMWKQILPGLPWIEERATATLPRGIATAMALQWAIFTPAARALCVEQSVLGIEAVARLLSVALASLHRGSTGSTVGMTWAEYVEASQKQRADATDAQKTVLTLQPTDFETVGMLQGLVAMNANDSAAADALHKSYKYAAFTEMSYGDLLGGDPAPTAVAAFEALLQPRRSARAQLRPHFDKILHLLFASACQELDCDEADAEPDEAAAEMARVYREAQWKHGCMLVLPSEGAGQVKELREQLAVRKNPSRLQPALLSRLDTALHCAKRARAVVTDSSGALLVGESMAAEALLALLCEIEVDDARRGSAGDFFGPKELLRVDALLTPSEATISSSTFQGMLDVHKRIEALGTAAARVRALYAPAQAAAGTAGTRVKAAGDGGDKTGVPAVYRDALAAELQSARYCVVKQRLLERQQTGGAEVSIDVLELAASGEASNAETGKAEPTLLSPLMQQYVWSTHQADAVDSEVEFLSDYAAAAWPRLLGRAVSRHLTLDMASVPEACKRLELGATYDQLKGADWKKLNLHYAKKVAEATRAGEALPKLGAVPMFTASRSATIAAAELRTLLPIADDVLSLAGYSRADDMRFGQLMLACARVLEVHGRVADGELIDELCSLLQRYLGSLGDAAHRTRTSKNPARPMPLASSILREAFAEVEEIEQECKQAEKQSRRLRRLGFRPNSAPGRAKEHVPEKPKKRVRENSGRRLSFANSGREVAVDGVAKYDAESIRKALGRGVCVIGIVATSMGLDAGVECGRRGTSHTAEAHRPADFRLSEYRLDGKAQQRMVVKRSPEEEPAEDASEDADDDDAPKDDSDDDDGDEPGAGASASANKRDGDDEGGGASGSGASRKSAERKQPKRREQPPPKQQSGRGTSQGKGARGGGRGGRSGGRGRSVPAGESSSVGAGDDAFPDDAASVASVDSEATQVCSAHAAPPLSVALASVLTGAEDAPHGASDSAHEPDVSATGRSNTSDASEVWSSTGTAAGAAGGGFKQGPSIDQVNASPASSPLISV